MTIIILGIVLILVLFSLQAFFEQMRTSISSVTGNAIIINTTADNPPVPTIIINHTSSDLPFVSQEQSFNPRLQCWVDGGLRADDIVIGKDFFEGFVCPEKKKEIVTADVREECLVITVGEDVETDICSEDHGMLSFDVGLPSGAAAVAPAVPKERSYNGLILFIAFLVTLMIVWREFELRERSREQLEHAKESHHRTLPPEHIERRVIKAAPLFKEILSEEEKLLNPLEVREIHEKLMQEQKLMVGGARLTHKEMSEYITNFNNLGKDISEELKRGNLSKARKKYLLLFPLYTRLYNSVDDAQKRELVDVIKYLHDQLNIMEKSRRIRHLIEEVYQETDKHRVDVQEPQKEDMKVLKEEHVAEAKHVFSQLAGEREQQRQLERKEVLKQIDKVSTTLQEKGVETPSAQSLQEELEALKRLVYGDKRKEKREQKD